jgi:hypothetical protein
MALRPPQLCLVKAAVSSREKLSWSRPGHAGGRERSFPSQAAPFRSGLLFSFGTRHSTVYPLLYSGLSIVDSTNIMNIYY